MKIDNLDWLDWLHKTREDSEQERKRRGLSGAEWLKELRVRADEFERERRDSQPSVARDRKTDA
jgi:hypothetical protein